MVITQWIRDREIDDICHDYLSSIRSGCDTEGVWTRAEDTQVNDKGAIHLSCKTWCIVELLKWILQYQVTEGRKMPCNSLKN